ncbi:MAG: hypothetical protein M3Y08_16295 [Fibrobacterota bacterium]|nr:hypothetical protein [Fibrobacterota bacterium]
MRTKILIPILAASIFVALALFLQNRGGTGIGTAVPKPIAPSSESRPAVTPITGQESAGSLKALADSVRVRALRGDTLGLIRLLIDDTLFRRHVWPASPSFDERENTFQFVRGMDKANSAKGLRRMLHDVQSLGAGRTPESLSVDSVPVKDGVVHTVKPTDGVRLFGGALEVNGAFRVLNYSESGSSRADASDG